MSEPHPTTPPQIDQLDHTPQAPSPAEKPFRDVLIGFLIHFTVYLLVNALLVFIDLRNPEEGYWVHWVIGGWGIGIFFHGLGVFLKWRKTKQNQTG